ncbi:MAG: class I SAM-dependent methyltransferase [Gemmatimonadetes bacterium]|uniref:Class I SAM-dependent methyltransferase n=1 Tax=Candidatus Kutchimonas denitrificans TaxID=3056748 RepID=A0AAE5CCD2_9BACT|nr:class I SAM-dependent methyltransferase [Gemmatimonadota bacterium]NIR75753.1 class I SAM-dependent methyltransferase [Candidatus Kutchimonas denitrificans]NIS00366.1 class I SAM-dependent methyltransferase [Gemmatimonadota bacterium]NIT66025.1 class I SAM-dependent methyltransferase [Gemmatimonadota bacterium]NIU53729.1 methyltransferase domain-containing protein [Gemmatimonadota bacterium]
MGKRTYDPRTYWDARLAKRWDLSGVGHACYSVGYNRWLYRAQGWALARALRRVRAPVSRMSVLDVGSGTGHWLKWYSRRDAGPLTALELSPAAAGRIRERFPEVTVVEGDIAELTLPANRFELVNMLGVIYHIVEPPAFERALESAARAIAPGGWLVLSDRLGSEEVRPARHVRFRPLACYEDRLPSLGLRIQLVQPIYTLLNGGLADAACSAPAVARNLVHGAEEAMAALLFALDRTPGLGHWANMRLLVAKKVGNSAEHSQAVEGPGVRTARCASV